MPFVSRTAAIAFFGLITGLAPFPVLAETPAWFTCPDSSEFKLRRDAEADALNAREHQPSAGSITSADLAAHARFSAMSYDMYAAYSNGRNPLEGLAAGLKPIALIYGDPGRQERLSPRKARDTKTFYGVVADDPFLNRRLVILRGTLQPNEWIRNLQARMQPFPASQTRRPFASDLRKRFESSALVHNGFMQIYSSFEMTRVADGARIPLSQGLEEFFVGRDVTFIGHSLGGALATIAGVDSALLSPADGARFRLVTFGAPRVGNADFARLAETVGRIDRVCNLVDLVPAVPPSTRLTPYVHMGKVFRISSFDWPQLENWHSKAGEQITCWHSIFAYAYMTGPVKSADGLADGCRAPQ